MMPAILTIVVLFPEHSTMRRGKVRRPSGESIKDGGESFAAAMRR